MKPMDNADAEDNVIDMVKKEVLIPEEEVVRPEIPISAGILREMRRLQQTQKALEANLGQMRTSYLEAESDLFRKIAACKKELAGNAKNALLAAGIEQSRAQTEWTIDLAKGTIEKA